MFVEILILSIAILSANGFPPPNSTKSPKIERTTDFSTTCIGKDKICVSKDHCPKGYINNVKNVSYTLPDKEQGCKLREVCCAFTGRVQGTSLKVRAPEENSRNTRDSVDLELTQSSADNDQVTQTFVDQFANFQTAEENFSAFAASRHLQLGCSAALLCVEEQFCTTDGTISPEPVSLTSRQRLQRVPLTTCKNPENGIIGKCCRDPNYVDPWPTGNLPANFSGGFDEKGFPRFLSSTTKAPAVSVKVEKQEPTLVSDTSIISSQFLIPPNQIPFENKDSGNTLIAKEPELRCGVRNKKLETNDLKTSFAEIPWQAMVLHSKEKKILCSGVLVSTSDVLTAANCVDSLSPNEVSIKLGEWKLGYELKHEEPLPYKIFNISSINIHPSYTREFGHYDLAVLHLDSPASFGFHINPLCLPKVKRSQSNGACIATGWGKSILQAHYAGAIMNAVHIDLLSMENCKERLIKDNLGLNTTDGVICGIATDNADNVCEADIGGPLACENENGLYELNGIYSQDNGCLSTNQVAIFAPLDETWLKETMDTSTSNTNEITEELLYSNDYQKSTLLTNNEYLPPN